ncbi:MAG: glycosyltransferase, partial [Thermoplasmata archaeon]
ERMRGDPVSFEMCGTGPELENIKKIVKEKDLKNVEVRGYIQEEEKKAILRESWLFIYPAKADTFGLSVFESLSSGIPVIVSNKFPVKEDTISIVYADFKNIEIIRKEIMEIYSNDDLYSSMREEARSIVEKRYSVENHIDSLLSIYTEMIKDPEYDVAMANTSKTKKHITDSKNKF